MNFYRYLISLLTCIGICICNFSHAQLQANFNMDYSAGCSPLSIKFTNTSTGISSTTKYKWDFGTGNSSVKKDAEATYIDADTYTVSLTVSDGGNSSTTSKTVIVYKKPSVDFSAVPDRGCAPMNVTLTANAQPGDGNIVNYLWDFGDGFTQGGSALSKVSHKYDVPQTPPVSLTVTNSFGCYTSLKKTGLIEVYSRLTSSFTPATKTLCAPGSIAFTNESEGSGSLTYAWDFGDGTFSNEQTPVHNYSTAGSFKVRLNVKNDAGCSVNSGIQTINVASFKADFDLPDVACVGTRVIFPNQSTRPYTGIKWFVNNNVAPTSSQGGNMGYSFSKVGSYKVKLVVNYNSCVDSVIKTVTVGAIPDLKGFLISSDNACGLPATYTFTDTSSDASSWVWKNLNNSTVFGSTQTAAANYTISGTDKIGLTVTTAEGCTKSVTKQIQFYETTAAIIIKKSTGSPQSMNRGCPGLGVTFSTTPANEITSFKWNLGDGTTSTQPEPAHVYNTPGSYPISLDYVTKNGCSGTLTLDSIYINPVKKVDFTVSPSPLICGNNKVSFIPNEELPNVDYIWLVQGAQTFYSLTPAPFEHRFDSAGIYTIALVIKSGSCSDTLVKKEFVTVVAPFPKITAENTCVGNRDVVTFNDATKKAVSWEWDFGDGTSLNYGALQPQVKHQYAQSGTYTAVLTATNGDCTVSDSVVVNVLLKQKPILASNSTVLCTSDSFLLNVSNFEPNPAADTTGAYTVSNIQFGDLTTSNGVLEPGAWSTGFSKRLYNFETGKTDLRIITTSSYFNCEDTTNFINVKTSGPKAKLLFDNNACFSSGVFLTDSSYGDPNYAIVKREWLYLDSTITATPSGNDVLLHFSQPGTYPVGIRVTDVNGCVQETPADDAHLVTLTGPAADFEASSYNVFVNTLVSFKNTTAFSDNCDMHFEFSDGSSSTDTRAYFLYDSVGVFPVKLIAVNTLSGCVDTVIKTITVKKVISKFSSEVIYTTIDNCPPLLVNFKNESTNSTSVKWFFGDGGESGNVDEVSHVYNSAGDYEVVLYSFDETGAKDTSTQIINVKGPTATFKADTLFGCGVLQVRLEAQPKNAVSFKWDFGDGNIVPTTDTFAVHTYVTPGMYTPGLILTDSAGCSAPSKMTGHIVLDSLNVVVNISPNLSICDSAFVRFTAIAKSLSSLQFQEPITYQWSSSLHPGQDVTTSNAGWNFNKTGVHDVVLAVSTPYGCKDTITEQVKVAKGVLASISSNTNICDGDSVYLKGNSIPMISGLGWEWIFGNGQTINSQDPPPMVFPTAGNQQIALVVTNGFCSDTAKYALPIKANPSLALALDKSNTCLGDSAIITATTSGSKIKWSPLTTVNQASGFTAVVNPALNTYYTATVSDSIGCTSVDSIMVNVIQPFKMDVAKEFFTCTGDKVQFTAKGAHHYLWTGNNYQSTDASPVLFPAATDLYQVVGYDDYSCFTDTAEFLCRVGKLPTVNAGPDLQTVAGEEFKMSLDYSNDAVGFRWTPDTYLSCPTCADTKVKPEKSLDYVITVTNDLGCIASDTVRVEMLCGSNLIFIPNAFTPNNDNLNDRFMIRGSGITIKRLAVFDRWGKVVFESKDLSPFDWNSGWDGRYNNIPQPQGSYVYMLEAVCEKGEAFTYKGTVTLIR